MTKQEKVAAWMESLGFSKLIDDTTPLHTTYFKQSGFELIDTFTATFFYDVMVEARMDEVKRRYVDLILEGVDEFKWKEYADDRLRHLKQEGKTNE